MSSDIVDDILNSDTGEPVEIELDTEEFQPKQKSKRIITEETRAKLRENLAKATEVRKKKAIEKKAQKELEKQRIKEMKKEQKEQARLYAQGILAQQKSKQSRSDDDSGFSDYSEEDSYTDEEEIPKQKSRANKGKTKQDKSRNRKPTKAELKEQQRLDKMEQMLQQIQIAQQKALEKPKVVRAAPTKKENVEVLKSNLLKLF